MRLDGLEIKVNIAGEQTSTAIEKLGLPDRPNKWQIYFIEDANAGAPGTPLLELGVILRARVRPDDDDDVTIKLRPCRGSQLTDRWVKDTEQLKVEADWSGDRKVLAASYTEKVSTSVIPDVVDQQRPFRSMFADQQLEFLAECVGVAINLDSLTVLPPVTAVRWKKVAVAPPELQLRAERWTVGDLDFLELSAVAPIEEAKEKQSAVTHFVESLGLEIPDDQEPKTRQVMELLVRTSLGEG